MTQSPTVLFIAGFGRSGTTLLERVLGEMTGIAALGEVVHLWRRGIALDESCGCGEPFLSCPFWSEVGERAFGGWSKVAVEHVEALRDRVDRARRVPRVVMHRPGSPTSADLAEYTSYYERLYAAAAATSGDKIVVDSSKHPSLAFVLRTRRDLDVRVVQMVRDARAVAHSWTKTVARPEASAGSDQEMSRWSAGMAAVQWTGHNALLEPLRRASRPSILVRHEDFLAEPAETVRRVATFAGVSQDVPVPVSPAGVASLTFAHTVSGNPARFATGQVPISDRDEWRSSFSARQRRTVTALSWPLLLRYHYPVRRPAGSR